MEDVIERLNQWKSSSELRKFRKDIRDAVEEIESLREQVSELQSLLELVEYESPDAWGLEVLIVDEGYEYLSLEHVALDEFEIEAVRKSYSKHTSIKKLPLYIIRGRS